MGKKIESLIALNAIGLLGWNGNICLLCGSENWCRSGGQSGEISMCIPSLAVCL